MEGGGSITTFVSGTFSFDFLRDDDVFEDDFDDDEDESLDDDELLELLDLDDWSSPVAAFLPAGFTGPSISSSSDFMQPFMSLLISRSLLDPSPSKLVSIFNFY